MPGPKGPIPAAAIVVKKPKKIKKPKKNKKK